ncbi:enoyl-CoA hydratase [Sutcliffiella rhizosphaerae]|uniref:2,3-dehydroadipyl-CoA hydratase n=1 Tax=Sutcliffiella rhizosphaerae TaxID=2880967 RepID=A0ABN8ADG3_9BACI|nr:enoyl-CoA hydratase [Sutcliffiella rhizosphaerae]CAG9622549.1 2,3-dehydroadipyl-CoA hydratase [Sutcliffiella rhizosphaerae]
MGMVNVMRKEQIAIVELNRPSSLNAMNVEMLFELDKVLDELSKEDSKVLVVKGNGNVFSAGGDIKMMVQNNVGAEFDEVMDTIGSIVTRLYSMQKVTISAIHGAAAGLGLSLALASDIVVAHKFTKLAMNFIKIGLVPDGGGHFFLEKRLGESKAKQLIWKGENISAEEACRLGLIDGVTGDELEEVVSNQIASILQAPFEAMMETKSIFTKTSLSRLEQFLELEKNAQRRMRQTPDHKEGIQAFIEKRKPIFSTKTSNGTKKL